MYVYINTSSSSSLFAQREHETFTPYIYRMKKMRYLQFERFDAQVFYFDSADIQNCIY